MRRRDERIVAKERFLCMICFRLSSYKPLMQKDFFVTGESGREDIGGTLISRAKGGSSTEQALSQQGDWMCPSSARIR
jgi:hypothetical protein